jgi:hypothetical protein
MMYDTEMENIASYRVIEDGWVENDYALAWRRVHLLIQSRREAEQHRVGDGSRYAVLEHWNQTNSLFYTHLRRRQAFLKTAEIHPQRLGVVATVY